MTIFPTLSVSAAQAGPGVYKVTAEIGLNVRSSPSVSSTRIGGINYGATFTVTQTSNEWGFVPSYNGWVCLDYAQLIQSSSGSTTSANIPNGYYYIVSKLNGSKVIDMYGAYTDNGIPAILWDYHGGDNQIFYFERLSDNTYRMRVKHSGLYLEVRNSSQNNGTDVAQWEWHDSYACKRWYIIDVGGGYYKFVNKESGKVMDVQGGNTGNGTRIQQYEFNGTNSQYFKLTQVVSGGSSTTTSNTFTPRTTAPSTSDTRYYRDNPFYQAGYGMPNCTTYAYGRAWELSGVKPNLNTGNARYWYNNDGGYPNRNDNYARGQTPKLGAIAVWGGKDGGAGHVAVVEAINGSRITISESSWSGTNFRTLVINSNGSDYLTGKGFLGYIYILG